MSSNQFENRMVFSKNIHEEARQASINIVEKKYLTKGARGNIFDATVEFKGKLKRFIIKEYFHSKRAAENARYAFEIYHLAKKAKLRVFATFRMGEDGKSILMTMGSSDEQILIASSTEKSIQDFGEPLIEEISDSDKFVENCFNEGLKAIKNNLCFLEPDVLFFIIDKSDPIKAQKIECVVGDFDNVICVSDSRSMTSYTTLKRIRSMLDELSENNFTPALQNDFSEKVKKAYNDAINKLNTINQKDGQE